MPQAHFSSEWEAPVLLKGLHTGGGRLGRTRQALQMKAVPLQMLPLPAVAVKDTCHDTVEKGDWRLGALLMRARVCTLVPTVIRGLRDKPRMLCSVIGQMGKCALTWRLVSHRGSKLACATLRRTWSVLSSNLPGSVSRLHMATAGSCHRPTAWPWGGSGSCHASWGGRCLQEQTAMGARVMEVGTQG